MPSVRNTSCFRVGIATPSHVPDPTGLFFSAGQYRGRSLGGACLKCACRGLGGRGEGVSDGLSLLLLSSVQHPAFYTPSTPGVWPSGPRFGSDTVLTLLKGIKRYFVSPVPLNMCHDVLGAVFNVPPFNWKLLPAFAVCEASEGPRVREGPSQEHPRSGCVLAPPGCPVSISHASTPIFPFTHWCVCPRLAVKTTAPLEGGSGRNSAAGCGVEGKQLLLWSWVSAVRRYLGSSAAPLLSLPRCEPLSFPDKVLWRGTL